jgi:hypothetical protein
VKIDGVVASEPFLVAAVSPLVTRSSVPAERLAADAAKARDWLTTLIADAHAAREAKEREAKEARKARRQGEGRRIRRAPRHRARGLAALAVTDPDLPSITPRPTRPQARRTARDPPDRLRAVPARVLPALERRATVCA